ncbi:tetratricopeptide repeat protein [Fibrobacterota bacterium]
MNIGKCHAERKAQKKQVKYMFRIALICIIVPGLLIPAVLPAASSGFSDWYQKGIELEEEGKLDRSVKAFESALKLRPKSPEALQGLAKSCRLVLVKRPRDRKIQKKYMEAIRKLDDQAEMKKACEYIVRKDKTAHAARFSLARIFLEQEDKNQAYKNIRMALKFSPRNQQYKDLLFKTIETDAQVKANFLRLKKAASKKDAATAIKHLYARGCVLRKQYTLAVKQYEAIYKKDKKILKGDRNAVRVFYIKKKYELAGILAEDYLKLKPEDKGVREMLVKSYERSGKDSVSLRRAMKDLVENDPKTKKWWLKLARLDRAAGDEAAAVENVKVWLERNPRSVSGYKFLLPLIVSDPGQKETYETCLEKLIALDPKRSRDRRRKLGLMKFEREEYAAAEKLLLRSVKHYPKDAEVWYKLGRARLKLNMEGKSEYSFKKAYLLKPDNPEYARAYGECLVSDKGIKANLKLFKLLDQHSPTLEEQVKLAKSYSFNKDHAGAARVWKKLSAMDPNFLKSRPEAVISQIKAGNIGDVLKQYDDFKGNYEINMELGKRMVSMGQKMDGVVYYIAAYKIKPKESSVILTIASLYEDLGEYSKSLDAYKHALELRPRDKKIQGQAIACAEKSGDTFSLKKICEIILEGDPASHQAHYALGNKLLQEGDKTNAGNHLRKAVRLQPRNGKYKQALKQAE